MPEREEPWLGIVYADRIVDLFDVERQIPRDQIAELKIGVGDIVKMDAAPSVVATHDSARKRIIDLLVAHEMNPSHPKAVVDEAAAYRLVDPQSDPTLGDLRDLPFVTIDNSDSRDLDQAVFIQRQVQPGTTRVQYRVYYALADASWFVRPGGALFDEAMSRAVTYYAPSIAVTMLPAVLSEDLISLNPNVDRRALVFKIDLDETGQVLNTQIERAVIQSHAKLSYAGVQAFFDDSVKNCKNLLEDQPWAESLRHLRTVGELRLAQAEARDVIAFDRRTTHIMIDPRTPTRFALAVRERMASEMYNEQISLLCNIEGAKHLEKLGRLTDDLQAIFRVHLPPLKDRMRQLKDQMAELVQARRLPALWHWDGKESLADYIERLPEQGGQIRIKQAIERMIMLTNRASHYADWSGPHHALGVDAYARFSSPMREMVGIFTHKELLEGLGFEPAEAIDADHQRRATIIEQANLARQRQKQLDKAVAMIAIDEFLAEDLDLEPPARRQLVATVMGVRKKTVYIRTDEFAVDLKIYLDELETRFRCQYQVSTIAAVPTDPHAPRFVIGDELRLKLYRHDDRHRYLFDSFS